MGRDNSGPELNTSKYKKEILRLRKENKALRSRYQHSQATSIEGMETFTLRLSPKGIIQVIN
jgi:hypothetical protein